MIAHRLLQGVQKVPTLFLKCHIPNNLFCTVKMSTYLERKDSSNYSDTEFKHLLKSFGIRTLATIIGRISHYHKFSLSGHQVCLVV